MSDVDKQASPLNNKEGTHKFLGKDNRRTIVQIVNSSSNSGASAQSFPLAKTMETSRTTPRFHEHVFEEKVTLSMPYKAIYNSNRTSCKTKKTRLP
eukprot:TRINITY_DN16425_c0_g1_i1.p2 TRINITY_DN16425_c0_g1~~TRINITY_DN16425_c0_g1_i1.p2  ORF type:complete len:109 (-),score=7.64 TRINITY_DN16425_c0_g1_i1:710-997(-)